jgi:hypothetical protein
MRITGLKEKFRENADDRKKAKGSAPTKRALDAKVRENAATKGAVVEECGHGWPLLELGKITSPRLIAGRTPMRSRTDRKRKWPKEVPLGEHTSLGPKSYCPDYRNLPVT